MGKRIAPQGCLVSRTLHQAWVTAVSVKTVCTAGVEEGFLWAGVWLLLWEVTASGRGAVQRSWLRAWLLGSQCQGPHTSIRFSSLVTLGKSLHLFRAFLWHDTTYLRGFHDHVQFLWFARRNQRTQHTVILTAMIYYSKRRQSKANKGNRWRSEVRGHQAQALRVPSQGRHIGGTESLQQKVWHGIWHVFSPGSSLETQCPGFLLGSGHAGTFCQHVSKSQTPRRKTGVQHKCTVCMNGLHEQWATLRRKWRKPSRNAHSQMPAKRGPTLQANLSQGGSLGPLRLITLFCPPAYRVVAGWIKWDDVKRWTHWLVSKHSASVDDYFESSGYEFRVVL